MDKALQVTIHCKWIPDGRFFLYGTERGWPIESERLAPLLLQWHQSSYYGTLVDHANCRFPLKDPHVTANGIVLDAYQALEFFAQKPYNRLVHWDWDAFTRSLFTIAPVLYQAVQAHRWFPDLSKWREGSFFWRLPDPVWDELGHDVKHKVLVTMDDVIVGKQERFHPLELGDRRIISKSRHIAEKLYNGEALLYRDVIPYWFHCSVDEFLEWKPESSEKWRKIKELLVQGAILGESLTDFFAAENFRDWAGLSKEQLPFTFVLQLEEPDEDGEPWKLRTLVRRKETADDLLPLNPVPEWVEPYRDALESLQAGILRLFPWLAMEDDADSLVKIKGELFEEEAWEFLSTASEVLLLFGIEILLPSWWEAVKDVKVRVKARVKSPEKGPSFVGLDALMEFEWRLSINDVELTEEEFQRIIEQKRHLLRLGNQWVKLDPEFIKKIKSLMEKAEKRGMRVQDLIEQQLRYGDEEPEEEFLAEENDEDIFQRIQIDLHPRLRAFVETLTHLNKLPDQPVPKALKGKLRPYQRKGMSWLYFLRQYRFGAILADDMGLGKTIQLIGYLLLVREREQIAEPALIICPTTVLGNWQKELERFAPGLQVYVHYGPNRLKGEDFSAKIGAGNNLAGKPDVVLTTYTLAQLDFADLERIEWDAIVLDEAQHIKNPQTKQSRAIRKLKGKHHIALTGTPMENQLTELWTIFDFVNKGYLGSLARFQERFVRPIERDKNREKIQELRNVIKPFILRRTKRDRDVALNLPEKLEQKAYCPLTAEQAALYQEIITETFAILDNLEGFERQGYVLRLINQLKQLCDHPALYLKDFSNENTWLKRSTKLEKLVEILDIVLEQEESALIFTQYIGMGQMMQTLLENRYGIQVPFLRGSTSKEMRDQMVAAFQNREFPVFILSLKAGGTGLNLTAANHVIHYDRWWNPAVENQATDRAYRIGQTKFVHVHKFITTGTLEEKIDAMLERKQALNEEIIQSDRWITELSDEELYQMLRLD